MIDFCKLTKIYFFAIHKLPQIGQNIIFCEHWDTETSFHAIATKKIVFNHMIFFPCHLGALVHETNLHVRGSKMAVVLVCFDLYKQI